MYIGIPLDCMKLDRPHQGTSGWPPDERGACARIHVYMRSVCVDLLDAAWGLAVCRISVSFTWVYRDGVWFGFVRFAQLLAVVLCWVVLVPGCCCAGSALFVSHA